MKKPHIVCIGGGTGLSVLLSGLISFDVSVTAIVTMCDDGGSTGRLRRELGALPVGDIRQCLASLSDDASVSRLLNFRFPGSRYGAPHLSLEGQSLGNLLLIAASEVTGDFVSGVELVSRLFHARGTVLPSTLTDVHIWAETTDGVTVKGEENIDLGRYHGSSTIHTLHLEPHNAKVYSGALKALRTADLIVAGPGDLYTSILPSFLVSDIAKTVRKSSVRKVFIANVANKPFETPHYTVSDFLNAFRRHLGFIPFSHVFVNNDTSVPIPSHLRYHYVVYDPEEVLKTGVKALPTDLVKKDYSIHHDAYKLAKLIVSLTSA